MSESRRPKYLEIKDDLAHRIQRGDFTAGRALPAQARLSQEYGVTLMTLRQALRGLQDDGLIVQQPGRGTFVAPTPALDLRSLGSLADDMRAQGVSLSTEVLAQGRRALPATAATGLGRPRGERALRLERLRRLGRRPAVHQVSWVPEPWAGDLLDVDFSQASLYGSLRERCGVSISTAAETLHARALAEPIARAAARPAGRPVMVAERITYDDGGVPVVWDSATILGDEVRVTARRSLSDVQLAWTAS